MATYQDKTELTHKVDPAFDNTYRPGTITPHSGIYICINCRDEIASNQGNPLPTQNHRQHPDPNKAIIWRLLVRTQNGPQSG